MDQGPEASASGPFLWPLKSRGEASFTCRRRRLRFRLGYDIGKQLAFELRHEVSQHELPLLQTLDLKLVEGGFFRDPGDRLIEVRMLALERCETRSNAFRIEIHENKRPLC